MDTKMNVEPNLDADLDTDMDEDLMALAAEFGGEDLQMLEREKVVLTQSLEGFASCFPDWDLHPPVRRK
ncbi:MAG: hypothetical protein Q4A41_01085 [Bacillota bacterium]|nr:hypothetical protein [Bacillota bacterium]